jgi:hypothetical protein
VSSTASATIPVDEARRQLRTHLFVAAMLWSDSGGAPVNVRNMSPTGALIESSTLPEPGAAVVLRRGSLEIAGRIAWKAGNKAGIAFGSTIYVADWMSRKPGGGAQERVDGIVSAFKTGVPIPAPAAGSSIIAGGDSLTAELMALRTELAELGNSLIGDVVLVATHPEIQVLDIAVQRIDRMIGRLGTQA